MIGFLAEKITDFFIRNNIISSDEREVYKYGAEITLSTILGFVLVLTIGALCKSIKESIIFLMCFASIRVFSGGYHADTYLKCNLAFMGIFSLTLTVKNIVLPYIEIHLAVSRLVILVVLMVLSIIIILLLSPVENKNKPLSAAEKTIYRNRSIFLSILWALTALSTYALNMQAYTIVPVTMFTIAILMIVEKIKQNLKIKKE